MQSNTKYVQTNREMICPPSGLFQRGPQPACHAGGLLPRSTRTKGLCGLKTSTAGGDDCGSPQNPIPAQVHETPPGQGGSFLVDKKNIQYPATALQVAGVLWTVLSWKRTPTRPPCDSTKAKAMQVRAWHGQTAAHLGRANWHHPCLTSTSVPRRSPSGPSPYAVPQLAS